MDYSDGVKYYFFRLLLLLGTDAVGLLLGKAVFWVIASVLPPSAESFKLFLVNDITGSVTATAVMLLLLGMVFHDDGKKHAAYENMDMIPVLTTLILLLAAYFVPVILYNPNDMDKVWFTAYYMLYYPCRWLMLVFGADIKTAAAAGMAVILFIMFVIYQLTYSDYKRKHPFTFKKHEQEDTEEQAEEG